MRAPLLPLLVGAGVPLVLAANASTAGNLCWRIDVDSSVMIQPSQQVHPVCLQLGVLPNVPSMLVIISKAHAVPSAMPLCVDVTSRTASGSETSATHCGTAAQPSSVEVRFSASHPMTHIFALESIQAESVEFGAWADKVSVPYPPLPAGTKLPPAPPPILKAECTRDEYLTLADCAEDAHALHCDVSTRASELECLEKYEGQLSTRCQVSLRQLSDCYLGSHFFPMEMASVMLLATAVFTLLCTVVRCCIRRFCRPAGGAERPSFSLEEPTELSDASDDDDPAAAPNAASAGGGTGGGSAAASAAAGSSGRGKPKPASEANEEEEDELPAYTQVVEGGALTVEPLSLGNIQYVPPAK